MAKKTRKSTFGGTFYLKHIFPDIFMDWSSAADLLAPGVRLINMGLISILILADNNNIFRLMLF
jgi:hypothetical protein